MSARNFVSALRAIRGRPLDKRITATALTALSNGVRKNVLYDFRNLRLTNPQGVADEELKTLVAAVDGPEWPRVVASFIQRRWPVDPQGSLDEAAIVQGCGGSRERAGSTIRFLADIPGAGASRSDAVERPEPTCADATVDGSLPSAVQGTVRPLVQISDGMVLLDGAALVNLSDEEIQNLAGLLKAFARLATG